MRMSFWNSYGRFDESFGISFANAWEDWQIRDLVLFLYFMQLQKFLYSVVLLFEARATKDYAKVTTVISG